MRKNHKIIFDKKTKIAPSSFWQNKTAKFNCNKKHATRRAYQLSLSFSSCCSKLASVPPSFGKALNSVLLVRGKM